MIDSRERTSNNIYDLAADSYPLDFDTNYTQFLKYVLVNRFARPTDVCLDIGIGNGIFAIPVARSVREVHGVDINAKMLTQCLHNLERASVHNVHLHERSATDLLFPDAFFDLVFSYSTLLMVPEPARAYREIFRVLRLGGSAVLDITGKFNLSRIHWTKYYQRHGHFGINAYALREIRAAFIGLGFEILEVYATGLLDQWKYIPGLARLGFLETVVHNTRGVPDRDYRASQRVPGLANRWYFVLRKPEVPRPAGAVGERVFPRTAAMGAIRKPQGERRGAGD